MNGHAAASGKGTKATIAKPHSDDPATTEAVSSSASPPADDFSSAFQLACRKPAPSTASVMPSVSSIPESSDRLGFALLPAVLVTEPHGVDVRFRRRFSDGRFLQSRLGKNAGLLENRISDGADVRVDTLEVADQVEMERRCLDALRGIARQPLDMRIGVRALEVAEEHLL